MKCMHIHFHIDGCMFSFIIYLKINQLLWASAYINSCVCVFSNWDIFPPFSRPAIYDVVEEKADSEPDFQYIPEKSPQDPTQLDQHALRDSMVTLKEGLGSGAILAQFDVRRNRNKHAHKQTWRISAHTEKHTNIRLESEVWSMGVEHFVTHFFPPSCTITSVTNIKHRHINVHKSRMNALISTKMPV